MPKTIGIMGGMGPAATVDLMSRIISMTEKLSWAEVKALRLRCWQVPEDLRQPEPTS